MLRPLPVLTIVLASCMSPAPATDVAAERGALLQADRSICSRDGGAGR